MKFYVNPRDLPMVTIKKMTVQLNGQALDALGSVEEVAVAYQDNQLHIMPIPESATATGFKVRTHRGGRRGASIGNKALVEWLKREGVDYGVYGARSNDQHLIADLSHKIASVSTERKPRQTKGKSQKKAS